MDKINTTIIRENKLKKINNKYLSKNKKKIKI